MLRIDARQWQVFVAGRRVHHGLVGCWLVGFGAVLIWHDRQDWPWRFR